MGRAGRSLLGVLPLLAGLAGPVHAALPTYELTIRDGH
ncbi:MAG TPA: cupredoxin domain-containing protein, partial [Pseudomonas sp.]|nr:cupredoxin domain-containing protein [Pseudomonas sp.]